jgi:hypothetical protein
VIVRSPVFFHQQCPVCGRIARVRVSLLGRRVFCQHCQGSFVATDSSMAADARESQASVVDDLIERADLLLARASVSRALSGSCRHEAR